MDYQALAELLFPDVTETPEQLEARFPQRNLPEGAVVSRMAPSPTGFVHLGNLVQGTISERMTHQSGGVLYLRVEDTDAKREIPGAVEVLINTLKFYNINFDEGATVDGDDGAYGPYRQRQRAAIYHVYAKKLVSEGKAYPCFCTEDELSALREKQEANKETTGYYGKYAVWRDRPMEDIQAQLAAGNPWVLRFRSEGSIDRQFKFDDLVKGKLTITENNVDHVLLKSDGIPTYHFAHAVDDHLMRTTHVVRGDEWLPSLPFHIQLFQALGFKLPKYVHIGPLMKMDGNSKRKLSKRKDPELALTYYKAEGFSTQAMREYLMTVLNSNFEDWRRANPTADLADFPFNLKKMSVSGALFDMAKLTDVSKTVISKMTAQEVFDLAHAWADRHQPELAALFDSDPAYAVAVLSIDRGGKKPRKDIAKWSDLADYISYFYNQTFTPCYDLTGNANPALAVQVLEQYKDLVDTADDKDTWFAKIKALCPQVGCTPNVKEYKQDPTAFKGHVGDVSTVIRVALTGRTNTPDLHAILALLGQKTAQARLNAALAHYKEEYHG